MSSFVKVILTEAQALPFDVILSEVEGTRWHNTATRQRVCLSAFLLFNQIKIIAQKMPATMPSLIESPPYFFCSTSQANLISLKRAMKV